MRVTGLSALALVAACGGVQAPATVHPSWEPLFGLYEFTGTTPGPSPIPVTGSLQLGPEGYQLTSNHGTCHDRLDRLWVGPEFGAGCKDIRVTFRHVEGGVAEDGRATVTALESREREECRTNANGERVCITVEVQIRVAHEARLRVRLLGAGTP